MYEEGLDVVSFPLERIYLRQFITFHPWQYHRRVDKLLQTGDRLTLTQCFWVCNELLIISFLIYESHFPVLERKSTALIQHCTAATLSDMWIKIHAAESLILFLVKILCLHYPQRNRTGDSLEQRFRMFYATGRWLASTWSGCRGLISLLVVFLNTHTLLFLVIFLPDADSNYNIWRNKSDLLQLPLEPRKTLTLKT